MSYAKKLIPSNGETREEYGLLFESDFTSSSKMAQYTVNGGNVTASISGGVMSVSGGTGTSSAFNPNDNIDINALSTGISTTLLGKWEQSITFKVKSFDSNVAGLLIGIRGTRLFSGAVGMYAGCVICNNAYNGVLFMAQTNGSTITAGVGATGPNPAMAIALNDVLKYTLVWTGCTYIFIVENLTKGLNETLKWTPDSSLLLAGHSIGKFNIVQRYGQQDIQEIRIKTSVLKNADYAVMGHSLADEFGASVLENGFVHKLAAYYPNKTFVKFAGPGLLTSEGLQQEAEIKAFGVKTVFMLNGVNDVSDSITTSTIIANMDATVAAFNADGINVIWCVNPPATGKNQSALNAHIKANYPNIDLNTALMGADENTANPYFYNIDHIHLNDLGEQTVADVFVASNIIV